MTMRRRCALPVFVMPPRRVRSPLVSSLATAPLYPISCRGLANRESVPTSATIVTAETTRDTAQGLERVDDGPHALGRRLHGFINRALESPDAVGHMLDLVEVIQQGGFLRRRAQNVRSSPSAGVSASTLSSAVGGRRPCRNRNFPNRWRARS